ncbi:MAG: transcriptional regulator [Hyphomicrobium sp.]|nr:transcriptional regulator [Hyphomicrobium sp.]
MAIKAKGKSKSQSRLRKEIVEISRDLRRMGAVSDTDHRKTTLKMLGRDGLPEVRPMSASDIVSVRERAGVSQAVMAGFMNVKVSTISQWERGTRRPTGAALKLLNVVRRGGLDVLR